MGEGPATRAERQEQTRRALVLAGREVFAQDGFHGARLGRIAELAGYSKGAVYSNFESKAALFLAVLDLNLETVAHEPGEHDDATGREDPRGPAAASEEDAELAEALSGFALATLEFIATAARDEDLRTRLGERVQAMLVGYYEPFAAERRSDEDVLEPADLAMLLAALDQGAALLTLSGTAAMNQRLLRTGLARLVAAGRLGDLDPEDGAAAEAAHDDEPALHRPDLRRRVADSIRE
jgi:AcrR family transcriptional regulator